MTRRIPLRPRLVRALVLVAVAAGLVRAGAAIRAPLHTAKRGLLASLLEERRETYGAAYVDGVDRLRARIPAGGTYLAIAGCEYGCEKWLRYDLSPRRMKLLDRARTGDPGSWAAAVGADPGARVLVVESADDAPREATLSELWAGAPSMPAARRDDGIVVAVDTPVDEAESLDPLLVEGWCQEPGDRPCAEVRFWLDGLPATVLGFERYPRPDVAKVLPEMGTCERAGYRARLRRPRGTAESSRLFVVFATDDGRWRKVGPIEVRWR